MNFGLRAEACYSHPQGLRKALKMGKSLKIDSTQRTNFGLMAMSQRMTKPRIVAEQQIDVCLKATRAQRTNSSLMAMLQRMKMRRVVVSWQTDISLQQMDSGLMVVLQQTVKPRVVTRPPEGENPIAKSASPYRQNPTGEREHTKDSPVKKEVDTILGGPCKARKGLYIREKYTQEARYPSQATVYTTNICPPWDITSKPEDIISQKHMQIRCATLTKMLWL